MSKNIKTRTDKESCLNGMVPIPIPWTPEKGKVFFKEIAIVIPDQGGLNERSFHASIAASDGVTTYYFESSFFMDFMRHHRGLTFIYHGAASCLHFLQQSVGSELDLYRDVEECRVWCTEILDRLLRLGLNGDPASDRQSFETCCQRYLKKDVTTATSDSSCRKNTEGRQGAPEQIDELTLESVARKAFHIFQLFQYFRQAFKVLNSRVSRETFGFVDNDHLLKMIRRFGVQTHHIQLMADIVFRHVTHYGIWVDVHGGVALREKLKCWQQRLSERLKRRGYVPGKKGCSKKLRKILKSIEETHPEILFDRSQNGDIRTSAESLKPFACIDPFVRHFLRYGKISRLLATYLNKMDKPRLHPTFDCLKRTGRSSAYGDIAAQNIPKKIRRLLMASPGYVLVAVDVKAAEIKSLCQACLSQFAGFSEMADIDDPHTYLAARILEKDIAGVTEADRAKAKAINFGLPGGMSASGLSRYAKKKFGVDMSLEEAEGFIKEWRAAFPEMDYFLREKNIGTRITGFLGLNTSDYCDIIGREYQTNLEPRTIGWRCHAVISGKPLDFSENGLISEEEADYFWNTIHRHIDKFPLKYHPSIRNRRSSRELGRELRRLAEPGSVITLTGRVRANADYRARHNTIFQGLAADGAKLALWKLFRNGYKIVNFIHDEIVVEVPEGSDTGEMERLILEGMAEVMPDVRIELKCRVDRHWS